MFPEITRDDVFRLETRRLWLRWPTMADAAALAAIAGRQDVADMTVQIPYPYPKAEACRQIEQWGAANAAGTGLVLMLTAKGLDRAPMGVVVVEPHEAGLKVGVLLDQAQWNQGFATEAVQAMVDIAFVLTETPSVAASVRVINPAARRVVERCGFAYEGTVLRPAPARGGMVPCDGFRLDRKAWISLKQWRMPLPHGSARGVAAGAPSVACDLKATA